MVFIFNFTYSCPGKNYLNWYGPQAQLVVTEPELIKEILNDKEGAFPKREPEAYMKKLLGDGIITTLGEKWFNLRKLSNHAFHAESLKVFFSTVFCFFLVGLLFAKQLISKKSFIYRE